MKNIIDKIINKKKTMILLFTFFAIQPLLDIYILFSEEVVQFFRFSPSTIIRILFVTYFAAITLIQCKFNIKKEKYIIGYLVTVVIYFVFHHLNCLKFRTHLPGNFEYSPIAEIFYFIRMLTPFALIYILYKNKFKKEYFYKIINIVVLTFSSTIIVTNILKISLTSYGGNRLIADNIFGWFTETSKSYGYYLLSSKGIFTSANQISGLLLMLFTITCYRMIIVPNKFNIFVMILQTLAMIMLGTRTASYGWIITIILVFIVYLFFCIIKKEMKFNKTILVIMMLLSIPLTIIQLYSPVMLRNVTIEPEIDPNAVIENSEIIDFDAQLAYYLDDLEEENFTLTDDLEDFLIESHYYFGINPGYIMEEDLYFYGGDPVFWLQTMGLERSTIVGNRNLELLITRRILELNGNTGDGWLGAGFSTFRNSGIYLEQDFRVHRYSLGNIGTILLLGPYFIVLFKALFIILTNYKNKFTMETIILMLAISLAIVAGWLSGHIMDELIVTIFIALISSMLLLNINAKDDEDAEN